MSDPFSPEGSNPEQKPQEVSAPETKQGGLWNDFGNAVGNGIENMRKDFAGENKETNSEFGTWDLRNTGTWDAGSNSEKEHKPTEGVSEQGQKSDSEVSQEEQEGDNPPENVSKKTGETPAAEEYGAWNLRPDEPGATPEKAQEQDASAPTQEIKPPVTPADVEQGKHADKTEEDDDKKPDEVPPADDGDDGGSVRIPKFGDGGAEGGNGHEYGGTGETEQEDEKPRFETTETKSTASYFETPGAKYDSLQNELRNKKKEAETEETDDKQATSPQDGPQEVPPTRNEHSPEPVKPAATFTPPPFFQYGRGGR